MPYPFTQWDYNLDRQISQITRPDGGVLIWTYDDLEVQAEQRTGKLLRVAYSPDVYPGDNVPTPVPSVMTSRTYYPATGQLETLTSGDMVTETFTYEGSLATDVQWSGGPIVGSPILHRAYNSDLRIFAETVNGTSEVAFAYDNDGLITQAGTEIVTPDPTSGRLNGTTLGKVTDAYGYDPVYGELSSYSAAFGTSTLLFSEGSPIARDGLGRITQKTESVVKPDGTYATHTYVYTYYPTGWLEDVTVDHSQTAHYVYDLNGNRLSTALPIAQPSSNATSGVGGAGSGMGGAGGSGGGFINPTPIAVYDDQDRMMSYGANTYSYTLNGELTDKVDTSSLPAKHTKYVYDALGNLKSVALPSGKTVTYAVDGENRRVWRDDGVTSRGWVYKDGLHIVAELDGTTGAVSKRFVYGSKKNVPDYMITGGNTHRIISDHVGSPRLVVDATGIPVQKIEYDEFGKVLSDTNPGFQPFGFAGGLYDADTGLVRFGARDYDAETWRWTAKDPTRFGGGMNLYLYASGDPVNKVDRDGRSLGTSILDEAAEAGEVVAEAAKDLVEGLEISAGGAAAICGGIAFIAFEQSTASDACDTQGNGCGGDYRKAPKDCAAEQTAAFNVCDGAYTDPVELGKCYVAAQLAYQACVAAGGLP